MTQTLFICRGLPGSGKSTFATQWVRQRPNDRARVNRDDIRFATFGKYVLDADQEKIVTTIEHATLRALLQAGKSVIVDNQNLRARYTKEYLKTAREFGVDVLHKDFEVELPELLRRNAARDRKVDERYIEDSYKKFTTRGQFSKFPVLDTDDSTTGVVRYEPDTTLPKAWIVDVDGTLAHIGEGGRSPFDWTRVLEDTVHDHVARLVRLLHANGNKILITSGRSDESREDTELWLQTNEIPYDHVFMRKAGDYRKDSIVKSEIFDADIRNEFNVEGVLDDRLAVVRVWHSLGLPLFRVGDPDSNF